jgi:hypothetical protein
MTWSTPKSHAVGLLALGLAFVPNAAAAQGATIEAPAEVPAGSEISVSWTGPNATTDFISIDPAGAPSTQYGSYVYATVAQPASLSVPDVPGSYEIRYHEGGSGYPVIGTRAVQVTDVTATFSALAPVAAGATVEIAWEGPGNQLDFISIDPVGSGDSSYGPYAYATSSPVSIRVPDQGGEYLVRYHLGGTGYRVIGQTALTVGAVSASLTAPSEAQAGSEIEVAWEGPGADLDYISVDPEGAPDGDYGPYVYVRDGTPLSLRVPDVPGQYQVRYHMGQSGAVIGSAPLVILPNTATVAGPETVVAGTEFEATWTGPDNAGDWVAIFPVGAEPRDYLDYGYTSEGSTLTLKAPVDAGPHEIRYMTGQSYQVLASVPITVTPGAVGTLRVVGEGSGAVPGPGSGAVEVILDASGSMLRRIDGVQMMELARRALDQLVNDIVPEGTPFALRVFGHREVDSCRTDLEIPVAPLAPASAASLIGGIQAMNLARTPIGASLGLVRQDLGAVVGPIVVVLITDGEETCDGDAAAEIASLVASGIDVRVNIVGFAIEEQQLRETFQQWARSGNGRYIEANDAAELAAAMSASLQLPFEVVGGGEVVAGGIVGGEPVRLPAGDYQVRILGPSPRELPVTIEPDGDHTVDANSP